MTPPRRNTCPLEVVEQENFALWCDSQKLVWLHVPNEGNRTKQGNIALRRQGLKKGAPDNLILMRPPNPEYSQYLGVAIELKRLKGGNANVPEQVEWRDNLRAAGWVAEIIRGASDAIKLLKKLGYETRSMPILEIL